MRGKLAKRIAFGVGVILAIGGILHWTGVSGGGYKQYPIDKLLPSKMYPTPETMETMNQLYAFVAPNGMKKPWKQYYDRQEFDKLLKYTFHTARKQYDWLINGIGISAMCHIVLPFNDPALREYEIEGVTKAANDFMNYPQRGIRWEAARLVLQQHLQGAAPKVAEALKTEKNPLVIQEMQAALKACGE